MAFTGRQRSCLTVMFVCLSVCLSFSLWSRGWTSSHRESSSPACSPWTWCLTVQGPPASDLWWPRLEICSNVFTWAHPTSDIWWPRLETCSNLFTWQPPLTLPSPVLTPCGYCSIYGWQVGGTHPTEMLSCIWNTTIRIMISPFSLFIEVDNVGDILSHKSKKVKCH